MKKLMFAMMMFVVCGLIYTPNGWAPPGSKRFGRTSPTVDNIGTYEEQGGQDGKNESGELPTSRDPECDRLAKMYGTKKITENEVTYFEKMCAHEYFEE